jgi:hypothetical protein
VGSDVVVGGWFVVAVVLGDGDGGAGVGDGDGSAGADGVVDG